jgi:3-hydroxy-9,10-secoandrosta-1,3,5(10)-triene-9,17-dione monooxygenase
MPPETVEDFHRTGILRAAQATRFGGFDLDYPVVLDIAAELGRGCGSAAWCYSIWASHNWLVGMFPEEAQQEYWAESADVLSSTSFNPLRARVTEADGGYVIGGQWDFSSGCDDAEWVLLGGMVSQGLAWFLVPRRDYTIKDTWFVSGLRGTGSKDIVMDDVFVPEHRMVLTSYLREGQSHGRQVHGTPNYCIPSTSMLSYTLAAPVLGMAQGAVEAFESQLTARAAVYSGEQLSESPLVHTKLAEVDAEVLSARLIMANDGHEVFAKAKRGEMPTLLDRARYRRNQAYISKLSVRVIDRLFEASGGHAVFDSNPIQRFHRDAHAASHHFGIAWDSIAEDYGRLRLGLELKNPTRI